MSGSPEKKQKTEADATAAAPAPEKKAAPEPPKELEEDTKKDTGAKIKDTVAFLTPDTTLNVLQSSVGSMLMPLTEGGLVRLSACARANVGIKSGRYMFEAKIVEQMNDKFCMCRVGFSAEGSLYLGEGSNSFCFDNHGNSWTKAKKEKCAVAFSRDVVVGVLLNLDESSPNANTVSLFRDGKRVSKPQPLPEELKGKTLFPAVSFRYCTVHCNFDAPAVALPFTCRTVQDASAKDAVVTKHEAPADGKYTALFPVCLPDEGSFDWLDTFLEKNPSYCELSDRSFAAWASKSAIPPMGKMKQSNDHYGNIPLEELPKMKRTLIDMASLQPRNFVIMEVKNNLIKEERAKTIAKFKGGSFKTVADVMVSEPPAAFKKGVQSKILKKKQDQADQEHRGKFLTEKRAWVAKKKTKDDEKAKRQRIKEAKKKAAADKKAKDAAQKKARKEMEKRKAKAEGKELPEEEEEEKEEENEEEEPADEPGWEPISDMEPEPEETEAPKASLTAEEKNQRFFKHATKDLTDKALALTFSRFSVPEASEFDQVKYSWVKENDSAAYVKNWILERKLTTRVEDIAPSATFRKKLGAWQQESGKWKNKHNEYKNMVAKKAADKAAKAKRKADAEKKAKLEAEKKAKEKEAKAAKAAEGEEEKEKEEEEPKKEDPVDEEEEEEEVVVDMETIDAFGVEDVTDIGNKVPLFRDFAFEDFALMTLRAELHLLVHAFREDSKDEDRKRIHVDHLAFYYQKYFGKALEFNSFGVKDATELIKLIDDSIVVTDQKVVESMIPSDVESHAVFVKIAEEARRHRLLQLDMGVESAKLKLQHKGAQNGHKDSAHKQSHDNKKGGSAKGAASKGTFGRGFMKTASTQFSKGKGKSGGRDFGKTGSKGAGKTKGKKRW